MLFAFTPMQSQLDFFGIHLQDTAAISAAIYQFYFFNTMVFIEMNVETFTPLVILESKLHSHTFS